MGGSSSSSQTIGYRYLMSIHMGISRGPINEIVEVRVGDKQAWPIPGGLYITDGPNNSPIQDTQAVTINAPNLFGGDKGEGGIVGNLQVYMGKPDQVFPATNKALMGGDVPDFRGTCTIFFDGLVCSLNPYPKVWKFRARRTTKGWENDDCWYPEKAKISLRNGAIIAMNPAHMIYESATNRSWGRGWPRSRIDDASFRAGADKLFEEGFGLCMRYNRQGKLSDFVQEVLNHIQGVIYTSRETGLLTFGLIRNDYDPLTLPVFDYETGLLSVEEPEIATRDEVVNEIIVKFRDPIRNEERSIRAHNLASIQSQGGARNTNTVEYMGIPVDSLAGRVAARDLRIGSVSGRRYKIVLDRRAWRLIPGSVFRINAPDKGISNLILRAGKVETRDIINGAITVTAIPDIFGMPETSYAGVQDSYWEQPDRIPKPPIFQTFREMTYRDLFNNLSRADLAQIGPTESYMGAFCTKPSNLSLSFGLFTKTSVETEYGGRDVDTFAPTLILASAVTAKATILPFSRVYDPSSIALPCAAQIETEIVRIDAITYDASGVSGTVRVARGCVDTIPFAHPATAPVILFDRFLGVDQREYAASEIVQAKLQTNTSSASLDIATAPVLTATANARQGRPYSAANIKINNVSIYDTFVAADDITVSWFHRDRTTLQDVMLGFFEGDSTAEPNTTYTVTFFDATKTYRTFSGITDKQVVYTKAQQDTDGLPDKTKTFTVSVATIRDGILAQVIPIATARRK